MTAFGLTTWAINRVGWAFGYFPYANPYATTVVDNSVYNYSQPIVMTPDEQTLAGDPGETAPATVSKQAMSTFEQAQKQFYDGDYAAALDLVDKALKEMPNDAVIHEFRALVLFALGKYQDAAATLYAVLSVGPGWDWTTMSSLYPQVSVYTAQLRKLEAYVGDHPDDAAARLVLAYHYITCDHKDAAVKQLTTLVKLSPQDRLAATLLQQLDPKAKVPDAPKIVEPPKQVAEIDPKSLPGVWTARRSNGERFKMTLDDKGKFSWKYTSGGKTQEVTGVYAVKDDGVLALEMNDDGVMLAQLDIKGRNMDFYMLGDTQGTKPLRFVRQ